MAKIKNLTEEFECSICMDRLVSPQNLPCGHLYCKYCLEIVLQFDDHGCATLTCPQKCSVTILEKDQTLDDVLQKIFPLESILKKLESQSHSKIVDCPQKHKQNVQRSHYCQVCHETTCKSCFEEHACEGNNHLNIGFDHQKKSFQPRCMDHHSFATHMCRECNNQLICIYGKHRRHKEHDVVELDSHVKNVKKTLTPHYRTARYIVQHINQTEEQLLNQFQECREKLSEELLVRRIIRVNRYITHLYEEESKILQQFDDRTNSFIQQRARKLESFTEVKSLMDNKNNIHTLAMISEQNVLLQKLQDVVKELSLKVILSDVTSDNTLGELCFESNPHVFQCSIAKDNVYEMILATDLRSVQKFHEEASSQMMKKYKNYTLSEATNIKKLTDLKMAMVFGHEKDTYDYMMAAVESNNPKILKVVLECTDAEFQINMKYGRGYTALLIASALGHSECVKLLLEHHCDIDIKDNDGDSALICASFRGNSECVKLLLEHHCDINSKNKKGETALLCASFQGHSECVKLLLEHHCDIDAKNNHGSTALTLASECGHSESVKLLLEHHCDIDIKDNDGDSALICASLRGRSKCVKLLLEHQCDIDVKNNYGNTAFTIASSRGYSECVKLLLEHQCDIDGKNNHENTYYCIFPRIS